MSIMVYRNPYGKILMAQTILLALSMGTEARTVSRPNIIYILADDLGYGDLSCYGQKHFETPNIDRLAEKGMLFTQHYAGCAVSAPSRSVLMSGLHAGHTTIRGNRQDPESSEGQIPISEETVTIAEMLKQNGYITGAFGKWGLGFIGTEGDPNRQGFDEFFGYNCQTIAHRYYPEYLWHNSEKVFLDGNGWKSKGTYSADLIQEKVLDFIAQNKDNTFFLYYPTTLPHAELIVPEDKLLDSMKVVLGNDEKAYLGNGGNSGTEYGEGMVIRNYCRQDYPHATFASMVLRLDRYVGEIMDRLEGLGLEDNTLIIFASDNGPHSAGGGDPDFFDGNGPFRGIKGSLYEGGIRVPMIVQWKGHIEPGTISDHISVFYDVKPTIADVLGLHMHEATDGISFLPELIGERQPEHEFLYWELHAKNGLQAVRMGKWKGVRKGVSRNPDSPIELYDLSSDISEGRNVAEEYPSVVEIIDSCMEKSHVKGEKFQFEYENK